MGDTSFYGPSKTVDTTKPFTIVTQFITADGTDTGTLSEIKRFYVQNGKTIPNSATSITGVSTLNYITDAWCAAQKTAFGDTNDFAAQGGLAQTGASFKQGTVLVLSIWDDYGANMLWLDSDYPTTKSATTPGVARGTCATTSGVPSDVEKSASNASVTYSNIKFGPIGSTFNAGGTGTGTTTNNPGGGTGTTTSTAPQSTQTKYGQCGGIGWTGPTVCASGSTCTSSNAYYSQCL
jgi:cellulose 1,4-beta-cellobiosidase